jgi:hypothetical protein
MSTREVIARELERLPEQDLEKLLDSCFRSGRATSKRPNLCSRPSPRWRKSGSRPNKWPHVSEQRRARSSPRNLHRSRYECLVLRSLRRPWCALLPGSGVRSSRNATPCVERNRCAVRNRCGNSSRIWLPGRAVQCLVRGSSTTHTRSWWPAPEPCAFRRKGAVIGMATRRAVGAPKHLRRFGLVPRPHHHWERNEPRQ